MIYLYTHIIITSQWYRYFIIWYYIISYFAADTQQIIIIFLTIYILWFYGYIVSIDSISYHITYLSVMPYIVCIDADAIYVIIYVHHHMISPFDTMYSYDKKNIDMRSILYRYIWAQLMLAIFPVDLLSLACRRYKHMLLMMFFRDLCYAILYCSRGLCQCNGSSNARNEQYTCSEVCMRIAYGTRRRHATSAQLWRNAVREVCHRVTFR